MTNQYDMLRKIYARLRSGELDPATRKFYIEQCRKNIREFYRDPLAERAAMAAVMADKQVNGKVYVYEWGRDCDQYESDSVTCITALPRLFEYLETMMYDGAEGPCAMSMITAAEARDFEPSHRDHAAEQMNY